MRRLQFPLVCLVASFALVSLTNSASAASSPLAGTWIVTQEIDQPSGDVGILARIGEAVPFVDVMHVDENLEIRDLSGVFHENGCGKVLSTVEGGTLTVPFNASVGIGDWTATREWAIRFSFIHLLYDCSGRPIGYAWVVRTGSPTFAGDELPGGPDAPPPWSARTEFTGWAGRTTVRFFGLDGEPLILHSGGDGIGFSEMSGPFRALRVNGEPVR